MTTAQKLAIRQNEIRIRSAALGGIETQTDETRSEIKSLREEYVDIETRMAALTLSEDKPIDTRHAEGNEGSEMRALIEKCNLGNIFEAAIEKRSVSGPEKELQEHHGLGENQIPLALLETRAVTPAPGDVGQNMAPIVPGVFPQSCAAFLGIDMPSVPVGDSVFPVLTKNATVHKPAESATAAETTGSFSADVLSPRRLQASFFYSREDRARFSGMSEALRQNLSDALSDSLDKQIIAGDPEGLLHGTVLANHNRTTLSDFAHYKAEFLYARVDGTWAFGAEEIRAVVGSSTYAHAATIYRANNSDDSALDVLMMKSGGVKVSAHVGDLDTNSRQNAIIRLGMRRDYVTPIWEGISLIPDEITKAASGEVVITAILLYAAKVLRVGGFFKVGTQTA